MSIVFDPVRDWGWPQTRACFCTGKGADGMCNCERRWAVGYILSPDALRAFRPRIRVKAGRKVIA